MGCTKSGSKTQLALFISLLMLMLPRRRLQPSCWSGAYQCWGVQNREVGYYVDIVLVSRGLASVITVP